MDVPRSLDPSVRSARERAYRRHTLLGLGLSFVVVTGAARLTASLRADEPPELPPLSDAIYLLPYAEVVEIHEVEAPSGGDAPATTLPPAPSLVLAQPEAETATDAPAEMPDEDGTPVPVADAAPTPPPLYPLPSAPAPGTFSASTGPPGGNGGPGTGRGAGTGDGNGEGDGDGGPAPLVERPDRSPVVVRFTEPAWPREAERENVRARVRIRVLVDERGRVEEAQVVERVRLGRGDREEPAPSLPFGMEAAALEAARRWQFRPAQEDGRPVRSYTTITCSFGV